MSELSFGAIALGSILVAVGCWLGWQMLRQNGRMLLRLDELEKRLDELEFGETSSSRSRLAGEALTEESGIRDPKSEVDQSLSREAGSAAASRFDDRSLARSRIKRDGLKAGTTAPGFRLPRLEGGELSLQDLHGQRVLLVFSDPHCRPCQVLAPQLEKFHRDYPELAVVMISRGGPKENRGKVKEHGLNFPVVLQQRWEISRLYGLFATPIAYVVDESGIIAADVAVGVEPILALMANAVAPAQETLTSVSKS